MGTGRYGDAEFADVQVNTRSDGGEQLTAPASTFPPATRFLPSLCKQCTLVCEPLKENFS